MINIRDLIVNQGFAKAILGSGGGSATDSVKEVELFSRKAVGGFTSNPTYNGIYTADLVFPESGLTDNVCDSFSVAVGGIYIVEWDGTEHEVVGQDASSLIPNGVILGNPLVIGQSDNGKPFAVGVVNGYGLTFASLTETFESHTIRIYQKAAFHLQEKTITENGEYTADDGFDGLLKVLVDVAASGSATIKKMASNLYNDKGDRYTFNHKYGVVPDIAMFYQIGTLSGDGTIAAVAFKDLTYSSRYGYHILKSGTTLSGNSYTSAAYTNNYSGSASIYMSETQIILPKRPSVQGTCEYTFIWINPPEA